jgi:hypothetical protein
VTIVAGGADKAIYGVPENECINLHFSQRGLLAASRRVGGAAGKFRRFRNVETTSPG